MTRTLAGHRTGFGAQQRTAFGLSLLCAISFFGVTAGPALAAPPGAPAGVSATPGNTSATVTWTAPLDTGGLPIDSYTVTTSGGEPEPIKVLPPFTDPVSTPVTGLTNGTTYTFTVTADNADGSTSANSNAVTPGTAPGPPTNVSARAHNASATISWTAPVNDGGSISSYTLTTSGVPGEITVVPPFSSPVVRTVTGLSNGTAYTFTVTAWNDYGSAFATTNPVTPSAAPGPPTNVSATAGNASASVTWSPPVDDGGAAITSYTVTTSGGVPGPITVLPPFSNPMVKTLTGLTNGTPYTFTVTATADGTGAGAVSNRVTPSTVPSAPTNVSASAGNASATVTWTAPVNNGGAPIAFYTVTVNGTGAPGPITVAFPASSATLTGLTNGMFYTFKVSATNTAGGTGPPSASVGPVSPVDAPVTAAAVRSGYWMVESDGTVYRFGDAVLFGDPRGALGTAQAVDLEPSPSGNGYWVVDHLGRVYGYGDAVSRGNVSGMPAGERASSLSATPSGAGYWIFTTRGRVVPFGDATVHGDMSAVALNGPVRDSIPTTSGRGYYMVASDGGIFAFGDAVFYGSMGATPLNAPVQSLVPDADGRGYWLVAADGGIFAFDAPFRGSMGATPLNQPITGMVRFGNGYLMVGTDGGIFNFSDRPFLGSLGASPPAHPIVSVAALAG